MMTYKSPGACSRMLVLIILALLLPLVGCSSNQPGSVLGKVSFNGKPLKGGSITFVPPAGPSNYSTILEDGSYQIEPVTAGPVKILVETQSLLPPAALLRRGAPRNAAPEGAAASADLSKTSMGAAAGSVNPRYVKIPDKYGELSTTDLEYTVKPGKQTYDIDLKP